MYTSYWLLKQAYEISYTYDLKDLPKYYDSDIYDDDVHHRYYYCYYTAR